MIKALYLLSFIKHQDGFFRTCCVQLMDHWCKLFYKLYRTVSLVNFVLSRYFKSCSIIYLMCLISYERVEVIGAPGEVANCSLSDTSSLCLVSNNVSVAYSAKKGRIVIIKIDQGDSVSMSSAMYREPNWRKMQRTSVQIWTQLKQKTSLLGKKSLREKLLIMICFLVGAVWSATPFLGWSHYSSSSIEANCVIDWKSKEPSSRSYNLATCLALFILPLSFNLLNYLKLFYHVIFKIYFLPHFLIILIC